MDFARQLKLREKGFIEKESPSAFLPILRSEMQLWVGLLGFRLGKKKKRKTQRMNTIDQVLDCITNK